MDIEELKERFPTALTESNEDYQTGEVVQLDMESGTVEGQIMAIIEVHGHGTFYQIMINPEAKPGRVSVTVTEAWFA